MTVFELISLFKWRLAIHLTEHCTLSVDVCRLQPYWWCSTYSLSVSLPWVVPQTYRAWQESHLHLNLCQMTDVGLLFLFLWRLEIRWQQNIARYWWKSFDCIPNVAVDCFLGYRSSIILMCLVQSVFFFKKPPNVFIILIKPVLMFAWWIS